MLREIVTFAMPLMHLVGKKCLQLFNETTLHRFHLHVTIILYNVTLMARKQKKF